jgi:gluconolactonase
VDLAAFGLSGLVQVAEGLDHPEAVTTSLDPAVLYAGGEAGQIYRIDTERRVAREIANVGAFVLGLCASGAPELLYVCAGEEILAVDPRDGSYAPYCRSVSGRALTLPNYCVLEDDGGLMATDSGDQFRGGRKGSVFRVPAGGGDGVELPLGDLAFPNGLALTSRELFVAESGTGRVLAVDRAGGATTFARFDSGVVDGLAATSDGGLVVSFFQPNRIAHLASDGRLLRSWIDPSGWGILTPTNVTFFGPHLRHLAIASLGGAEIKAMPFETSGLPLNYPRPTGGPKGWHR